MKKIIFLSGFVTIWAFFLFIYVAKIMKSNFMIKNSNTLKNYKERKI